MITGMFQSVKKFFNMTKKKEQVKQTVRLEAPKPNQTKEQELEDAYNGYKRQMRIRRMKPMKYKNFLRRSQFPLEHNEDGGFHFPPMKPIKRITDKSRDAEVHRERLRGDRPTRKEWRTMMKIRHRSEPRLKVREAA